MNDIINNLNAEVKEIDRQLVFLFNHRFKLCKQINQERIKNNCYLIHNPEQEQMMLNDLSKEEDYQGMVAAIWPTILRFSEGLH